MKDLDWTILERAFLTIADHGGGVSITRVWRRLISDLRNELAKVTREYSKSLDVVEESQLSKVECQARAAIQPCVADCFKA